VRPLATALLILTLACSASAETTTPPRTSAPGKPPAKMAKLVKLERVVKSKHKPVFLTAAPGDTSGLLYVVEKDGYIRLLENGALDEAPFLEITDKVSGGPEQGLLGLAFHPDYAKNGRFFVNYTDTNGDTRIVEYKVSTHSRIADDESAKELLFIDQPYSNHNGGHLAFGPDGKLYIGTGDGGSANDPKGNGQKPSSLLAKMLAVDVDAAKPKADIVALGLRNPWRYSFDRKTGDLFIADVGQDKWEEIDVVAGGKLNGENFGWNVVEGIDHCAQKKSCSSKGFVDPVVEYGHNEGCSITGGEVYRGKAIPELDGIYFYADYCTGLLRGFRFDQGKVADHWDWKSAIDPKSTLATISSFGTDANGELYVLSLDGAIWKLARAAE
jgi:glucose/arabinose dehydrogenase